MTRIPKYGFSERNATNYVTGVFGQALIIGKICKIDKRPVVPQGQIAEVLSGMWFVDYITIFHEPDPLKLVQAGKPVRCTGNKYCIRAISDFSGNIFLVNQLNRWNM